MLVNPTRGISCKHLKFLSTWHTALVTSLSTMTYHYFMSCSSNHMHMFYYWKKFKLFWTFVQTSWSKGVGLSRLVVKLGWISKRVFQENKARQIFRKSSISYPLCVSGSKKCSFFGEFGVVSFLETPVLRFALSPYYWRNSFLKWAIF